MRIRLLPGVTLDIDDRLRQRVRTAGERMRVNVRAYLLSAADDVDSAGDKVRDICDAAVHRVDSAVANVNERIGPVRSRREPEPESEEHVQAG